ncbi:hypothetical protein CEXT_380181 [Caerostris extrusa]|uniref:Uncharacterized protein n=1 Tax=Caerostris extrusa TaxID=172846 RepID=A0AAV4SS45_CAEEX|nr:hypothetical protein CEXT_380181 [Caerostris extrusa]
MNPSEGIICLLDLSPLRVLFLSGESAILKSQTGQHSAFCKRMEGRRNLQRIALERKSRAKTLVSPYKCQVFAGFDSDL